MSDEHALYGPRLNPIEMERALEHIFTRNDVVGQAGRRGTPVCIWGTHGVGKTQLVQDFARSRGWEFAYCAPAQFEEMGDLHGLPEVAEGGPDRKGGEYTIFRPPSWVPTKPGPGILLLDDMNRADDRILRGLMQLLQNFELFSWQLPERWQIVATANPEGSDYSVTPMDDAMLTRLLHLVLVFDVKAWARWAQRAGVDPRGVSFVLTYPELVTGRRTTPRTLAQFFEQIQGIGDLRANRDLAGVLAQTCLDPATAAAFLAFVNDDLEALVSPEEILGADGFEAVKPRLTQAASGPAGLRVDRIATMCTRMFLHVAAHRGPLSERSRNNLLEFILWEDLPNDLRTSLCMDFSREGHEAARDVVRDRRVAALLLGAM